MKLFILLISTTAVTAGEVGVDIPFPDWEVRDRNRVVVLWDAMQNLRIGTITLGEIPFHSISPSKRIRPQFCEGGMGDAYGWPCQRPIANVNSRNHGHTPGRYEYLPITPSYSYYCDTHFDGKRWHWSWTEFAFMCVFVPLYIGGPFLGTPLLVIGVIWVVIRMLRKKERDPDHLSRSWIRNAEVLTIRKEDA